MYYRDAAAAFVVFDLTRIATFEAAAKWKDDLDMKVETRFTIMGGGVPKVYSWTDSSH